jgi:hypothetical protein
MTAAHGNNTEFRAPEIVSTIHQRSLGVGIIFGIAALIVAFLPATRDQFFHSYLLGFMLWLGITLGSMAILMIQHMTGGMWGMVIRRQLEAAVKTLPLLALLFVPIIFGMSSLYTGNHEAVGGWPGWLYYNGPDGHLKMMSHSYLMRWGTPQFLFLNGYIGRAIVYFVIWIGLGYLLVRKSAQQDSPPVENLAPRFRRISAPGLILYAFSITFAVIDWVMSLDPHWISTIYGFIFIAGELISAICLMVVVEAIMSRYEPTASLLKAKEVHDHGNLMLTFIMLWAYFSFSQLLIIWAGNLPTEIRFFTRRLNSGWQEIGLALVVFHFFVPFFMLLSRPFKRDPHKLVWLAGLLLFMRFVDLFWYIEPNFHKNVLGGLSGYWLDLVVPIAIGGFWLALFFRNLRTRPLLPVYDLHAQEFLEYAGAVHE